MSEIILKNVSFSYDKHNLVLKNIDINFEEGKIYCLMGNNGSGKTTLCDLIANLQQISQGEISYFGNIFLSNKKNKKTFLKINKEIGYLFQNCEEQLFNDTVLNEVKYTLDNFNYPSKIATEIAKNYLEKFRISETYYNESPFLLSQGQKRRVALASIFCANYHVYILDEPTMNLDYSSKMILSKELLELKKKNKIIILVSHDMDWSYEIADEYLLLDKGKIIKKDRSFIFFEEEKVRNILKQVPFVHSIITKLIQKNNSFRFLKLLSIRSATQLASILKEVMYHK